MKTSVREFPKNSPATWGWWFWLSFTRLICYGNKSILQRDHLVGGFNPNEKYESNWIISQGRGVTNRLKQPPSYCRFVPCPPVRSPPMQQSQPTVPITRLRLLANEAGMAACGASVVGFGVFIITTTLPQRLVSCLERNFETVLVWWFKKLQCTPLKGTCEICRFIAVPFKFPLQLARFQHIDVKACYNFIRDHSSTGFRIHRHTHLQLGYSH